MPTGTMSGQNSISSPSSSVRHRDWSVPNAECLHKADSPLALSQEDTQVHIDAANTSNYLTKAVCRVRLEQLAHALRMNYGVGASGPYKDVVVGFSDLQILLPIAFYGTIAAGGIFSCASHSFTPAELARQIEQGGANLVICSKDLKDVAVEAARMCRIGMDRVLVLDSDYQNWSCRSVEGNKSLFGEKRLTWERVTDPVVLENSIINLLYSSGTTGAPKGKFVSSAWRPYD
jgi:4-coumarate--CoA ligase